MRGFNDYLARCSYGLQEGIFVADVLYYYGDQGPNFVKEKNIANYVGKGYDFDAVNSDVILHRLDVKDGRWVLPEGQSYAILALTPSEEMPLGILSKLETLVKKGGVLVGKKPTKVHTLDDYMRKEVELRRIAEAMWRISGMQSYGKGKVYSAATISSALTSENIRPDVLWKSSLDSGKIKWIHRKWSGEVHAYLFPIKDLQRTKYN